MGALAEGVQDEQPVPALVRDEDAVVGRLPGEDDTGEQRRIGGQEGKAARVG